MKKLLTVVVLAVLLVGCTEDKKQTNATKEDQKISASILAGYQKSQPVPKMNWSQLRQNLIEIETAQVKTTATTSFFFNQGIQDPIISCPSIGFPIPATYQLTNPQQVVTHGYSDARSGTAIPQIEANGVFTADTTGTYVICVDAKGKPYASYWEGFVNTITGPAKWNVETHQVELIGSPSFEFSKGK